MTTVLKRPYPAYLVLAAAAVSMAVAGCRQPAPEGSLPPPHARLPAQPPGVSHETELEWGCVYTGEGTVAWIPARAGAQPRILEQYPGGQIWHEPVISPDHTKVALLAEDLALKVIDLATGETRVLAPGLEGAEDSRMNLVWSPDGTRVAYDERRDLHVTTLDGWRKQLTNTGDVSCFAWSPDGTRLAVGRRDQNEKDMGLWIVPADGGEPKRLVPGTNDVFGVSSPAWSPDGKIIAFTHAWEGGTLCFVRPDGSDARLDVGPASGPLFWLSDSSAVVYDAAPNEETDEGIHACQPRGKPWRVASGTICSYDMRPNGDLVLVREAKAAGEEPAVKVRIVVIPNAVRGDKEQWSREIDGSYAVARWRPDGKAVAASTIYQEGPGKLYIAEVGGELILLSDQAQGLSGWARARPATPGGPS